MNKIISSIVIFLLTGFLSKKSYAQYNITSDNCPICTENEELQIRIASRQMDVIGSTPDRDFINGYPAKKLTSDSWGNWYPMSLYKKTLHGYISCFDIHAMGKECDFNHYIVPSQNYRDLVELASPRRSNLIINKNLGDCNRRGSLQWHDCEGGDNNCIEAEITLDNNFRETEFFSERDKTSVLFERNACFYGPWVTEWIHNHRPEIHPSELMWWKENENYNLLMIQDDSDRFNEEKNFWKYQGINARNDLNWKPWAASPMKGRFKIAFELDPQYEYKEYEIEVNANQGLLVSNERANYLEDGTTFTVHDLFYDDNLVLSVIEDTRYDEEIGVNIVDICKDNDGILRGFIEINAVIEETAINVIRGGGVITGNPTLESGFLALTVIKTEMTFEDGVTLFDNNSFRGNSLNLPRQEDGYYNLRDFNNTTSSLIIGNDFRVTLFDEQNCLGRCRSFNNSTRRLSRRRLNNRASSIFIDYTPDNYDKVIIHDNRFSNSCSLYKNLEEGKYNTQDIYPLNDRVSTVAIPPKYEVTLYENNHFGGNYVRLPTIEDRSHILQLPRNREVASFNNITSSIYVDDRSNNNEQVQFYSEGDFSGKYISLGPGEYKLNEILPVGDDEISSIKISCPCFVYLYEDDNFEGDTLALGSPERFLGLFFPDPPVYPIEVSDLSEFRKTFDDKTSSVKIVNWKDAQAAVWRDFFASLRMDVGFIHPRDLISDFQVVINPYFQYLLEEKVNISYNKTAFKNFKIDDNRILFEKIPLFEENRFEINFNKNHTFEFEIPQLTLINAHTKIEYYSEKKSNLSLSSVAAKLGFKLVFNNELEVRRYNKLLANFVPFYSIIENGSIKPEEKSSFVEQVNKNLFSDSKTMKFIKYESNAFLSEVKTNKEIVKININTESKIVQNDFISLNYMDEDKLQRVYIENSLSDKMNNKYPIIVEEFNCYIPLNSEKQIELLLSDFEDIMFIKNGKLLTAYKALNNPKADNLKTVKALSRKEDMLITSFMQASFDKKLSIGEFIILMKIVERK